jgi:hypothetical protein
MMIRIRLHYFTKIYLILLVYYELEYMCDIPGGGGVIDLYFMYFVRLVFFLM